MDIETLKACTGATDNDAAKYADLLDTALADFDINSPQRIASFLSQVGWESGHLHYVKEIWGPTEAQSSYEGRSDLGNTESGDGRRFLGRGLLQVTGRANYTTIGEALATDFVSNPELLEEPDYALRSACYFWKKHGLNELADNDQFEDITRRINGGLNGYSGRLALYQSAKKVLGV